VEFLIAKRLSNWMVKRGHTAGLRFETREAAVRAAENLAKAAAGAGERALVKLEADGRVEEIAAFEPAPLQRLEVAAAPAPARR
jgi:hypothetical protein